MNVGLIKLITDYANAIDNYQPTNTRQLITELEAVGAFSESSAITVGDYSYWIRYFDSYPEIVRQTCNQG